MASYATARWPFAPTNPSELPLAAGEHIQVLRKLDSVWWEGVNQSGRTGVFPASYVEESAPAAAYSAAYPMPAASMAAAPPVPSRPPRTDSPARPPVAVRALPTVPGGAAAAPPVVLPPRPQPAVPPRNGSGIAHRPAPAPPGAAPSQPPPVAARPVPALPDRPASAGGPPAVPPHPTSMSPRAAASTGPTVSPRPGAPPVSPRSNLHPMSVPGYDPRNGPPLPPRLYLQAGYVPSSGAGSYVPPAPPVEPVAPPPTPAAAPSPDNPPAAAPVGGRPGRPGVNREAPQTAMKQLYAKKPAAAAAPAAPAGPAPVAVRRPVEEEPEPLPPQMPYPLPRVIVPPVNPASTNKKVKVMLLGDRGVGKSAFLYNLVQGVWYDQYVPTEAPQIFHLTTIAEHGRTSDPVDWEFWDMPGAYEPFILARHAYYDAADMFVIFFDYMNRYSYDNAFDVWNDELQETKQYMKATFLVATKTDLQTKNTRERSQLRHLDCMDLCGRLDPQKHFEITTALRDQWAGAFCTALGKAAFLPLSHSRITHRTDRVISERKKAGKVGVGGSIKNELLHIKDMKH